MRRYLIFIIGVVLLAVCSMSAAHSTGAYFSDTAHGTITVTIGDWDNDKKCHKHDHKNHHHKDCGADGDDESNTHAAPNGSSGREPDSGDSSGADKPVPTIRSQDGQHDADDSSGVSSPSDPTPSPTPEQ